MERRLKLHAELKELLGSGNVYFQPPPSIQMKYPAIVYSRDSITNRHADDSVYRQNDSYEIIVIDKNPDSEIPRKISLLPLCSFDRAYISDNLIHTVFTLYY